MIGLSFLLININEENASHVARGYLSVDGHLEPKLPYRIYPEVLFDITFVPIVFVMWLLLVGLLHLKDFCIGAPAGCLCWRRNLVAQPAPAQGHWHLVQPAAAG